MRALLILVVVGACHAQPVRLDKFVQRVERMPKERMQACALGCYVLTQTEFAGALKNAADLSAKRALARKEAK